MPAIKWEQAGSVDVLTLESSGAALANNTIVALSVPYPGNVDLDTYGYVIIDGVWAIAPTDINPALVLYASEDVDAAGLSSAPVTGGVDCGDQRLDSAPIRKVTTTQRKVLKIPLEPYATTYYIDNQTGQTLSAGWTAKLSKNNPESQ